MATLDAVDRGRLGCGETLGDALRCRFDGEDLKDCPLLCLFIVHMAVCLMLVLLDCGGFMIDSSVLDDEMM